MAKIIVCLVLSAVCESENNHNMAFIWAGKAKLMANNRLSPHYVDLSQF